MSRAPRSLQSQCSLTKQENCTPPAATTIHQHRIAPLWTYCIMLLPGEETRSQGRETMFSHLTRWSLWWWSADNCAVYFSQSKYFRGEKRTSRENNSIIEKMISCLFVFPALTVFVLWYWNCKTQATLTATCKFLTDNNALDYPSSL